MVMLCAPVWTVWLYGPFEYTIQRTNVAKLVQMQYDMYTQNGNSIKSKMCSVIASLIQSQCATYNSMNYEYSLFVCFAIEMNDWRMHFKLPDILMGWSFGRLSGDYMKFAPILETPLMCPRYCASVKSETAFSNADCPDGTIGVMHRHHNRVV